MSPTSEALPPSDDGPGLWLVVWHRSGNTRYGNRGDIWVRLERSVDAEPRQRRWEQGGFRYEARWNGRVAETLGDGSVRTEDGQTFPADLFSWRRREPTSHPPGVAPPAAGPY